MFKIRFLGVFAVIGFVLVGGINTAHAQKIIQTMKKPMPELPVIDEEKFNNSSTLHNYVPFNDENLSYSVRLPKNWSKRDTTALSGFSINNKVLGEVDRYYGPARLGERSYFTIKAVEIDYKLTAEQWMMLYMLENGYALQGVRTISDSRVEVLYVLLDRNITYVVSAVAQLNGNRMIFAQYAAPSIAWKEESGTSQKVIQSFALNNIDDGFVEPMVPYQFLDIAQVQYPDSWELKAKPLRNMDRMSISLFNVQAKNEFTSKKILKGQMEAHLFSEYVVEEDIDDEVANFLQEASVNQLLIDDEIEEITDLRPKEEGFEVIQIKSFNAIDKAQSASNYEYWLAVLYSGEYYYFLSLLTPSRDNNYYDWARNTQTFRVLVENTKTLGQDE